MRTGEGGIIDDVVFNFFEEVWQMKKLFSALIVAVIFLMFGCGNSSNNSTSNTNTKKESTTQEVSVKEQTTWNKSDLNLKTNGNMQLAFSLVKDNANLQSLAEDADATEVMKRSWDYYGKVIRFSGYAAVLQDYPPGHDMSQAIGGESCEIVMTNENESVIVDGMLRGSTKGLQNGDLVTFCGYSVGIMEVPNKVGGNFSHLIVVGVK